MDKITKSRDILFEKDYTYAGELYQGKYHGKGIKSWPDFSYLEGEWQEGLLISGTVRDCFDKVLMSGRFNQKGELDDDFGALRVEDGELFVGSIKNGKRNGFGRQFYLYSPENDNSHIFLDSSGIFVEVGSIHLEGHWTNDKRDGIFKVYDSDGKNVRNREFQQGEAVVQIDKLSFKIIEEEQLGQGTGNLQNSPIGLQKEAEKQDKQQERKPYPEGERQISTLESQENIGSRSVSSTSDSTANVKKRTVRIVSSDFNEEDKKNMSSENTSTENIGSIGSYYKYFTMNKSEVDRFYSGWLSSNNLNFYIDYLNLGLRKNQSRIKIVILGTWISEYFQAKVEDLSLIKNCTRQYTLPATRYSESCALIFDTADRILFPLNIGNHWTLAEINCERKDQYELLIYDSLLTPTGLYHHCRHLDVVYDYFSFEVKENTRENPKLAEAYFKKCKKDWSYKSPVLSRQQNGSDCGVFVLGWLKKIAEGTKIDTFYQKDAALFRKELAALATSCL